MLQTQLKMPASSGIFPQKSFKHTFAASSVLLATLIASSVACADGIVIGIPVVLPLVVVGPIISGNTATGVNSIASGLNNSVYGLGSTAIGGGNTAIGAFSSASGQNSVALGAGSSDGGVANVVSVGTTTQTRTITNVTAGVNNTDAANVG